MNVLEAVREKAGREGLLTDSEAFDQALRRLIHRPEKCGIAVIPTLWEVWLEEHLSSERLEFIWEKFLLNYPSERYWIWENEEIREVSAEDFLDFMRGWREEYIVSQ